MGSLPDLVPPKWTLHTPSALSREDGIFITVKQRALLLTVVKVVVTVGPVYFARVVVSRGGVGSASSSTSSTLVLVIMVVVPPCTQMYCRPGVLTEFGQSVETK